MQSARSTILKSVAAIIGSAALGALSSCAPTTDTTPNNSAGLEAHSNQTFTIKPRVFLSPGRGDITEFSSISVEHILREDFGPNGVMREDADLKPDENKIYIAPVNALIEIDMSVTGDNLLPEKIYQRRISGTNGQEKYPEFTLMAGGIKLDLPENWADGRVQVAVQTGDRFSTFSMRAPDYFMVLPEGRHSLTFSQGANKLSVNVTSNVGEIQNINLSK